MSQHADTIIVAMSGGVDSSVAAVLLKQQGYRLVGVTLQLWGKDACSTAGTRLCCSVRDTLDAKAVSRKSGIPHRVLKLEKLFHEKVIDYFVSSYRVGRTPNPCIACNDHIKFGELLAYADKQHAQGVATGHYARIAYDPNRQRYTLRKAIDLSKDQSYMLFNLRQDQLARALFPLGELTKDDVRDLARSMQLRNAEKPDSQDICFVRDRDKNGFLKRKLDVPNAPGPIVDLEGVVLGEHQGLLGYTIGQREGLGIAVGKPLYVIRIEQAHNRLVVGPRAALLNTVMEVDQVNWISITAPHTPLQAHVKIRSRHEPAAATLTPLDNGQRVRVCFDTPQSAITPGQAAVFYDQDLVLGGGWILR